MKNISFWKSPFFYAIIAGVLFFLLLRQCSETRNAKENIGIALNDTIVHYKNKIGQIVSEKTALKGDKNTLKILLSKKNEQLKRAVNSFDKVNSAGNIKTVTKIDTVEIKYIDTVDFVFSRLWEKSSKWYNVSGKSTQKGIDIEKLTIPNTLSYVVGKKNGKYKINAVNSNPHIKTTGLDSYVLEVPKKRIGVSIYAGYGVGSNGFEPQLGIGISYNLFNF